MKKYLAFTSALCLFLCCCTDHNDTSYEPLYLNETNENVLLLWSHPEETESVGEVKIAPKDTGYCLPGEVFPILLKSGLHGIDDYPLFNVRLVFGDEEKNVCFLKTMNSLNVILEDSRPMKILALAISA